MSTKYNPSGSGMMAARTPPGSVIGAPPVEMTVEPAVFSLPMVDSMSLTLICRRVAPGS